MPISKLVDKGLSPVDALRPQAYAIADIIVPLRSYPKQALVCGQHYQVISQDGDSLSLKSPNGQIHTVNPRRFRKAIYQQQSTEIALGDRLVFRLGDRTEKLQGQVVVVGLSENQATVRWKNGYQRTVDLSQAHLFDFAWVELLDAKTKRNGQRTFVAVDEPVVSVSDSDVVANVLPQVQIELTDEQADLMRRIRVATKNFSEFMAESRSGVEFPVSQLPQSDNDDRAIASSSIEQKQQDIRDTQARAIAPSNTNKQQDARAIAQVAYQALLHHAIQHNQSEVIVDNYRIRLADDSLSVLTLDGRSVVVVDREKNISESIEPVDVEVFKQIHLRLQSLQMKERQGRSR
jgi:hypothetical protein